MRGSVNMDAIESTLKEVERLKSQQVESNRSPRNCTSSMTIQQLNSNGQVIVDDFTTFGSKRSKWNRSSHQKSMSEANAASIVS